jgi:sec-independent protein translocase protein TatC
MSLINHLRELRNRAMWIAIGLLLGTVVGWILSGKTLEWLFSPLLAIGEAKHLDIAPNYQGVSDPLDMKLRVALFLGVLVSSPWWIYQLWAFVTPGLTKKERRRSYAFVGLAVPLFLAGVAFAWWAVPNVLSLFVEVTPQGAYNFIDAQTYLAFITQVLLTFGFTFLLPLFMVGLTIPQLVRGRTWLKAWRWAVVLIALIAAIVTPTPDVLSMVLVASPLVVLYFAAVGIGLLLDRRADKKAAAEGLLVDVETE